MYWTVRMKKNDQKWTCIIYILTSSKQLRHWTKSSAVISGWGFNVLLMQGPNCGIGVWHAYAFFFSSEKGLEKCIDSVKNTVSITREVMLAGNRPRKENKPAWYLVRKGTPFFSIKKKVRKGSSHPSLTAFKIKFIANIPNRPGCDCS